MNEIPRRDKNPNRSHLTDPDVSKLLFDNSNEMIGFDTDQLIKVQKAAEDLRIAVREYPSTTYSELEDIFYDVLEDIIGRNMPEVPGMNSDSAEPTLDKSVLPENVIDLCTRHRHNGAKTN